MDPQPNAESVIELYRYYTTLKKETSYKKFLSWITNSNIAVVDVSQASRLMEMREPIPNMSEHRSM